MSRLARRQTGAPLAAVEATIEPSAFVSLLLDLTRRETPEATAGAVCDAVRLTVGPASVAVLAFQGRDRLVPLAFIQATSSGPSAMRVETVGRRAYDRAIRGPWIDEGQDGATVSIPLGTHERPYGVLSVAMDAREAVASDVLPVLVEIAAIAQALLIDDLIARANHHEVNEWLARVVAERGLRPVFEPIVDLVNDEVLGYQAGIRFADGSQPERRFREARLASAMAELEAVTIEAVIGAAALLPRGRWLGLDVSPDMVLDTDRVRPLLARARQRVVVGLADDLGVDDPAAIRAAVARLGPEVELAVREGGPAAAPLSSILELEPAFVRLDMSLIRRVDTDPARQALVAGMAHFAGLVGCRLIAEGVASEAERRALRTLGVRIGQGHLLGRPASALRHVQTIDARTRRGQAVGVARARSAASEVGSH